MMATQQSSAVDRRQIGPIGTTARIVLGLLLIGFGALGGRVVVSQGHLQLQWDWAALAVGLVGFPALLVAMQWIRMNRNATRLQETGPLPTAINILVSPYSLAQPRCQQ